MEVASLSSQSSLCRLYHRGQRFSERPSVVLNTSRRLFLAYSTDKLSVLKHTCHNARKSSSFLPWTQSTLKWKHFNQREELYKARYNNNLHDQGKISRCVIVRSELAGVGSSGAASSVSDIKLASKVRGVCFYTITAINAIILFVLMLAGHPFVMLLDRHRRKFHHFIAKLWAFFTVAPFYSIKFEGLENLPSPDTPAVYVSNHQSFLDIYTLLTLGRSFKFISKTGIFVFPIIGWAMFFLGVIPLKRMDSRSQLDCFKRCMDLIKKGASVFFFPEGTRSKDGKLGTFKKGAFSVAAKTQVPVVPITLIGTGKIMPVGQESILNPGSVKVVIHKPISGNNPEILCSEARSAIATVLRC